MPRRWISENESPTTRMRVAASWAPDSEGPIAPAALLVRSIDEAIDFLPQLDAIGRRLLRRCWPGPVFLEIPAESTTGGLLDSLSDSVRTHLVSGFLTCGFPSESLFHDVARLISAPLVASIKGSALTSHGLY